ncbi:hypothetical protein [Sphingomonas bacterium]|uniref:hypothetical protein n=1 Tax=Sphingomonas bacterium TaxID=1895847 RepID=UPI001C2DA279|nr:hypothetical protein [Sphingomonas bacterium]
MYLLLQTTTPTPATKQWSILHDPCAAASDEQGKDIVVCGHPDAITPRLPLPQYRGAPDHPVPSNPDLSAAVALNGPSGRGECGAYGEGCPVAGGGYVAPKLVEGALDLAHGLKKRHYKGKGVSIPLDEPAVGDMKGRLLP